MRRFVFIISVIVLSFQTVCAQSSMKWRIGGQYGVVGSLFGSRYVEPDFAMSLTLGFDMAVNESPWRIGIEAGAMNQGIMDYSFFDEEDDRFVRANYAYVGAYTDYEFQFKGKNLFVRGGIGPAYQMDMYCFHTEYSIVPLFITGIGIDWNFAKGMLQGYVSPRGDVVMTASIGLYIGKKKK